MAWRTIVFLYIIPYVLGKRIVSTNLTMMDANDTQLGMEGIVARISDAVVQKHLVENAFGEAVLKHEVENESDADVQKHGVENVTSTGAFLDPPDIKQILKRSQPMWYKYADTHGGKQWIKAELSSGGTGDRKIGFFLMGGQEEGTNGKLNYYDWEKPGEKRGEWFMMAPRDKRYDPLTFWNSEYTLTFIVTGSLTFDIFDKGNGLGVQYSGPFEPSLAEQIASGVYVMGKSQSRRLIMHEFTEWLQSLVPPGIIARVVKVDKSSRFGWFNVGHQRHCQALELQYEIMIPEHLSDQVRSIQQMFSPTGKNWKQMIEDQLIDGRMVERVVGSRSRLPVYVSAYPVYQSPDFHGKLSTFVSLSGFQQEWLGSVRPPLSEDMSKIGSFSLEVTLKQFSEVWLATEATFHLNKDSIVDKAIAPLVDNPLTRGLGQIGNAMLSFVPFREDSDEPEVETKSDKITFSMDPAPAYEMRKRGVAPGTSNAEHVAFTELRKRGELEARKEAQRRAARDAENAALEVARQAEKTARRAERHQRHEAKRAEEEARNVKLMGRAGIGVGDIVQLVNPLPAGFIIPGSNPPQEDPMAGGPNMAGFVKEIDARQGLVGVQVNTRGGLRKSWYPVAALKKKVYSSGTA